MCISFFYVVLELFCLKPFLFDLLYLQHRNSCFSKRILVLLVIFFFYIFMSRLWLPILLSLKEISITHHELGTRLIEHL
ncbi:hypothetical protein BY458DRAFT_515193, partial [Sporodiniella umbellata]